MEYQSFHLFVLLGALRSVIPAVANTPIPLASTMVNRNRTATSARRYDVPPVVIQYIIRMLVEFPFWCAIFMFNTLRESAVVRKLLNCCLDVVIYTIQRILQDPTINDCLCTTIASGMNVFIQQPELDKLLLHMATSLSKTQPDIARQQGQDFPMIVSSFVQGMIHAVKTNNNNHQSNKLNKLVDDQQRSPQRIFRSPSRTKALVGEQHVNENDDIVSLECDSNLDAHEIADSESEEESSKRRERLDSLVLASTLSTSRASSSENLATISLGLENDSSDRVTPLRSNQSLTPSEMDCYEKPTYTQHRSTTSPKVTKQNIEDASASSSIFHFPMFGGGIKNRKDVGEKCVENA
jgi:hypothetical protein